MAPNITAAPKTLFNEETVATVIGIPNTQIVLILILLLSLWANKKSIGSLFQVYC